MGVYEQELVVSVRTYQSYGADQLVQSIVQDLGMAGGHGSMAGAHVPLEDMAPRRVVHVLTQRALEALKVPPETKGEKLIP
jgi:hypothetical protein